MKLLVVLLAIGLSASEKLNRAYLPPPDAKLAGGNSENLQTPFDFPKKTPIYGPGFNDKARFGDGETGTFGRIYFQTNAYPRNGFETTVTPLVPEMGYEKSQTSFSGFRYPMNHLFHQERIPDYIGKPGNMKITTVPDIMQNYQPKAFGMYGGNPMLIRSYLGSPPQEFESIQMPKKYNSNNLNYHSGDLSISDNMNTPDSKKSFMPDAIRIPLTPDLSYNSEITQYISTTARPNQLVTSRKFVAQNEARKYKQPKRPQAAADKNAEIIDNENVLNPEGYSYSFDTSNGIHKDEIATTANGVKALGSYSYTGDDGKVYSVVYSADENGFQPRGDHLPTPPPIPEAIQMVIEQAKKDKEAGIIHDGFYDDKKYGHMKYQGPLDRFLKNKENSFKVTNRNKVLGSKKMHKKPVAIEDTNESDSDHRKDDQQKHQANKLNGQFGMKRVSAVPRNEEYATKNQNARIINLRRPITSVVYQQNQPRLRKPSGSLYNSYGPVTNKNRGVQSPTSSKTRFTNNIAQLSNMATSNTYENQSADMNILDLSKVPRKMSTPQDAGYLYVPPRNIFIEGRFQDKPTLIKEAPNQYGKNYDSVETTAEVPESQRYYIDQTDKNNQFQEGHISKSANYITTTEESIIQSTYESTNRDVDQSIDSEKFISANVFSSDNNATFTTAQPYGNTLSTNSYNKDYTDDNPQQEDNIYLYNRDNDGLTRNYIENNSYHSTTTTPSNTEYTNQPLVDSNQYEATFPPIRYDNTPPNSETNYPENEGYFRTSPELPANFEDLPLSKNRPIYKVDGVQTELTPNIKVDGFGKPIQDTYNANFPNVNDYFSTGILLNDKNINDKSRSTVVNPKNVEGLFTDKAAGPEDSIMDDHDDSSELESATVADYGNKKMTTDGVIGEDFRGPKQQQRYDPETGYFY